MIKKEIILITIYKEMKKKIVKNKYIFFLLLFKKNSEFCWKLGAKNLKISFSITHDYYIEKFIIYVHALFPKINFFDNYKLKYY